MSFNIAGDCSSMPDLSYYTRFGSDCDIGISTSDYDIADTANMIYRSNSSSNLSTLFPGVSYSSIAYDYDSSFDSSNEGFNVGDEQEIISVC